MRKQEALQAMRNGHNIVHENHSPKESLHMENGMIINELDCFMGYAADPYWAEIVPEDGWLIVEPKLMSSRKNTKYYAEQTLTLKIKKERDIFRYGSASIIKPRS
jgi:hypothetical protein